LLVAFGATAFPGRFLAAASQGAQRVASVNLIGLVQGLGNIVLSLLFLHLGLGLLALALGILLSGLMSLALQAILFARIYRLAALAPSLVRMDSLRGLIGFSLQVFITGVSWTIVASTDTLVIGAVLGSAAVTLFVVNYRIPSQLVAFLNLGADASLPGMAELSGEGSLGAAATRRLSALVGLASGVCAAGVATFLRPFVEIWVGAGYVPSMLLLILVSYLVVHHPVQHALATLLTAARRIEAFAVISVIEAALNVVLSIALTSRLGVAGALLGTGIAGSLNVIYLLYRVGRLSEQSSIVMLLQLYAPAVTCVLLGLAVGIPLVQWLEPTDWLSLVLAGSVWLMLLAIVLASLDQLFMGSRYRSLLVFLVRATISGQSGIRDGRVGD
jgi:O-antigen/teichoic acid export membrane protein